MKYILLLFWSAVLVTVLNYVVSAINNTPFNQESFINGLIFSLVFSVIILVISSIFPKDSAEEASH